MSSSRSSSSSSRGGSRSVSSSVDCSSSSSSKQYGLDRLKGVIEQLKTFRRVSIERN